MRWASTNTFLKSAVIEMRLGVGDSDSLGILSEISASNARRSKPALLKQNVASLFPSSKIAISKCCVSNSGSPRRIAIRLERLKIWLARSLTAKSRYCSCLNLLRTMSRSADRFRSCCCKRRLSIFVAPHSETVIRPSTKCEVPMESCFRASDSCIAISITCFAYSLFGIFPIVIISGPDSRCFSTSSRIVRK